MKVTNKTGTKVHAFSLLERQTVSMISLSMEAGNEDFAHGCWSTTSRVSIVDVQFSNAVSLH